ncbi:hypothetical protein ACGFXC_24285 [Streptomyces sp. NPDC048507]|uniref:hypothetical protein n=1 Tax=unclassified Streptomyces TaxID=2593676 RepID=UPI000F7ABFEC|nr:hypothetical protein [Streptomyces sp. WAC07149]RST07915.1 hypothetical protein EF910_05615 [Streptomyces sp. WAC07149]
MGILDRAPLELVVYELVESDDGYGGTIPGRGRRHTLRVFAQPIDADDNASQGWSEPGRYKILARDFPTFRWGDVEFEGRTWTVSEYPRRHRGSRRTAFVSAVIERRGSHGVGRPTDQ